MSESRAYVDGLLKVWGERWGWSPQHKKPKMGRSPSGLRVALKVKHRPAVTAQTVRRALHSFVQKAPQVMVKISGGAKGMAPIRAHMDYIARHGLLSLENERGDTFLGKEELRDLAEQWEQGGEPIPEQSQYRESINIVLSMPNGTKPDVVLESAKAFAWEEFGDNHQYALVLHDEATDPKRNAVKHPHVHLTVKSKGFDGRRLNPRKADLREWRERFAHHLRERGVDAQSTPRKSRFKREKGVPFVSRAMHKYRGMEPRRRPGTVNLTVKARAEKNEKDALKDYQVLATALAKSQDPKDRKLAIDLAAALGEILPQRNRAAGVEQSRGLEQGQQGQPRPPDRERGPER